MQGRRSVWSDQRILAMTSKFVCAADEVWRLQRDDDPECRWFRAAVRGDAEPVRGTMQGTYVITPQGRLLGRINSPNPDQVLQVLTKALAAWDSMSDAERSQATTDRPEPVHRWEDSYPAAGLVLERFARDLGDSPLEQPRAPVNRDAVWFANNELRGWLPEAKVGAKSDVNPDLIERLARFVLVDNVRGQTVPYARAELQGCGLRSKVLAIRGSRIDIEITGYSKATAKGPWLDDDNYWKPKREFARQLSCRIFGKATFDRDTERFISFELVATGDRQGRTTFNGRAKDEPNSSHRIGFLLRLADTSYRVAPTFINTYRAEWVVRPARTPQQKSK
ncbi:MAG: hypothetical protein ACI85K_002523 [Hyphomicrobiaceae bacterium]